MSQISKLATRFFVMFFLATAQCNLLLPLAAQGQTQIATPVCLDLVWKKPLGKGYSGIAVSLDCCVTLFSDGNTDWAVAFDCRDGAERWRYELGSTYRGHDGSQDGPISTPCIAGDRVFVLAPRGKLSALNLSDGNEIWSVELTSKYNAIKPHWGFGTSPLVIDGVLLVQVGAADGMIYGFEPQSGQRLWAAGNDTVNYQSPIPFQSDSGGCVLAAGDNRVYCLNVRDGAIVWEYAHEGSGEYGAICLVPVPLDDRRVLLKHSDNAAKLVQCGTETSKATVTKMWESPSLRKSYAVPVYHAGHLYGFNGRILTCVDEQTGQIAWRSREPGDGFPLVVDGHLVIMCKTGQLSMGSADGRAFDELDNTQVFDKDLVWSPPTHDSGRLIVRSFGEIARVDLRSSDSAIVSLAEANPDVAGTRLERLLKELESTTDKNATISQFLIESKSFPLIESNGKVVFVYRGEGTDVALGGDITGFGSKVKMHRVPQTDLFYTSVQLEPDARVCYAFIREFQAVPDELNPKRSSLSGVDEDLELDFTGQSREVSWMAMPAWKPPTHFAPVETSKRGQVVSKTFHSETLNKEISISVYLPPGYEKGDRRFPVAYMHSGQVARDSLEIPLTLDNLIGESVEPMIAVFIEENAPFFGLEGYAKMSGVELPSFVDQNFRTAATRDDRAQIAWGFAAMAAAQTAVAHSEMNGKLAVQSPFVLSPSFLDPFMKRANEMPFKIYIDWGKYDTRSPLEFWDVAEFGRMLTAYFRERGYEPLGGQFNEGADIPGWRNRTDDMLQTLFPIR